MSSNPPAAKPSLSTIIEDAVEDAPELVSFVQAAEGAIAAIPKTGAKPSDYMKMAAAILTAGAPLADQIQAQTKPSA